MKNSVIILCCAAVLMAGCNRAREKDSAPVAISVKTTLPVRQTFRQSLQYTGTVMAWQEADLGTSMPGKVEKIYFGEGMPVEKGAVLVELSAELLTSAIIENEALRKDYERLVRLGEKGSISQMEVDHIRAKYEASQIKVDLLRKNTEIVAPFSGTIVDIFVHEGENFSLVPTVDQQNQTLSNGILRLMQLNPLKVRIELNEKDLADVAVGSETTLSFACYPDKIFHGSIRYIRPALLASSRSATAEIRLDNPGSLLKPGMFANVGILLPEEEGLFVPISAVSRQPGTSQDYVFVVIDSKAVRVPVKRMHTAGSMVAVQGIAEDQQVIGAGKGKIADGVRVDVQNR